MSNLIRVIQSKIVKKDNKYQVQSEKGKNLGTYDTKSEAEKRLKQVEMFKHMKKSKQLNMNELDKLVKEKEKQDYLDIVKFVQDNGFPTDDELLSYYNTYKENLNKGVYENRSEWIPETPISFEQFKKNKVYDYWQKLNKEPKLKTPDVRKWFVSDDEWIDTDDDPIEEPKDTQI